MLEKHSICLINQPIPNVYFLYSERSEECIRFTMRVVSKMNFYFNSENLNILWNVYFTVIFLILSVPDVESNNCTVMFFFIIKCLGNSNGAEHRILVWHVSNLISVENKLIDL